MGQDSVICGTWLILCGTWLIHMRYMTLWYVECESFTCGTWLNCIEDMTHLYKGHDASIYGTHLIHMRDMARSHAGVMCKWRAMTHSTSSEVCRYYTRLLSHTYNITQIWSAETFRPVYAIKGVLFPRGSWREVGGEAKQIPTLASHIPVVCVDIQKSAVSLKRCNFVSSIYASLCMWIKDAVLCIRRDWAKNSSTCVAWLFDTWTWLLMCDWDDSSMYVTWLIDTCGHTLLDTSYWYMWARLVDMCGYDTRMHVDTTDRCVKMTHPSVWHKWLIHVDTN